MGKKNEREPIIIHVIYDFQANNSMKMASWYLKENSKTVRAGMEKVIKNNLLIKHLFLCLKEEKRDIY